MPITGYNDVLNEYRQGHTSTETLNSTETFRNQNQLAFRSHLGLEYMFQDIGEYRLIIANNAIFTPSSMEALKDIALDIEVLHSEGNTITNVTIDTEIANSLLNNREELSNFLSPSNCIHAGVSDLRFDSSIDSGNLLFSNITEAREAAYEEAVLSMRNESVSNLTPELGEFLVETFRSGSVTVYEFSPTEASETSNLTEDSSHDNTLNEMVMAWRERIQVIFSSQNPNREPLPSWSEVPTRPSEHLALEQWERDNVMRRYWATRLNNGYSLLNIFVRDSPYEDLDWFYEGYTDLEVNQDNYDIFQEDDLGLERLFDDNNYDISQEESASDELQVIFANYDIFQEDDLGLEALFNEHS